MPFPAAVPQGLTQYLLCRRLGGFPGRFGWVQKILPFTRIYSLNCPACSESLYLLHYPGPFHDYTCSYIIGAVPFYYISLYMFIKQNSLPVVICAHNFQRVSAAWSSGGIDENYNSSLVPATASCADNLIPVHTATSRFLNIQFALSFIHTHFLQSVFLLFRFST